MGLQEILWSIENLLSSWQNVLDLLLVAAVFFLILILVRGTRAATLLRGIGVALLLLWSLSFLLNLQAFSWLLSRTLTALSIALPVIFQEELRRWLDRLGRIVPLFGEDAVTSKEREDLVAQIAKAVDFMSAEKIGALIVLELETGLQEYIESGVPLEAVATNELIKTIFYDKTPLHDGAVIVRNNRLVAAACTLPISASRKIPDPQMGLRHRAALGISEVSDAVAIVVSEESGRITVAVGGRFRKVMDVERLAMILGEYIRPRESRRRLRAWLKRLRRTS